MAADGDQSPAAAGDFERCLQLVGTDLRDDDLVATLSALWAYYVMRGDLRRAVQEIGSLRAGLAEGRQWFRPAIEAFCGVVAWMRGEFDAAQAHLEQAVAGLDLADEHLIDAVWFLPDDLIAAAHIYLALVCLMRKCIVCPRRWPSSCMTVWVRQAPNGIRRWRLRSLQP